MNNQIKGGKFKRNAYYNRQLNLTNSYLKHMTVSGNNVWDLVITILLYSYQLEYIQGKLLVQILGEKNVW